jgi:hypothetical protein
LTVTDSREPADLDNLDNLLQGVDCLYGRVKLSSYVKDLVAPRIREEIPREAWAPFFDGPYTVSSGAWELRDRDAVFAISAEGRSHEMKYFLEAGLWLPSDDLEMALKGATLFASAQIVREEGRRSTLVSPAQPSGKKIHEKVKVDFKWGRHRFLYRLPENLDFSPGFFRLFTALPFLMAYVDSEEW